MNTPTAEIVNFEPANTGSLAPSLVVILASGPEDGGKRATLAYTAAVTALGMDSPVKIFLAGDGAWWGYEDRCDDYRINGFPPLDELVDTFRELGGETWICSTCDQYCGIPGDGDNAGRTRRKDVLPRGMASVIPVIAGGSSVTF